MRRHTGLFLACLWPVPPSLLRLSISETGRLPLLCGGPLLAWGPMEEPLGSSPASSLLSFAILQLRRASLSVPCFLPSLLRCRGRLTHSAQTGCPFQVPQHLSVSPTPETHFPSRYKHLGPSLPHVPEALHPGFFPAWSLVSSKSVLFPLQPRAASSLWVAGLAASWA